MKYTGLIGNDIQYSRSPEIHNSYYEKYNIPLYYKIIDLKKDELLNFIKNVRLYNIVGFNVTIPYKRQIIEFLNEIEYPANKIKSVNTVVVGKDKLIGFNTDYYGFIQSLRYNKVSIKNNRALIIGSGGAARSIYYALLDLKIQSIDILVRNVSNIEYEFDKVDKILSTKGENDLSNYDLIINCTPIGGENYKNDSLITLKNTKKGLLVYDLNYSPKKSRLLKEAENLGANVMNGELMLKLQAYKAIEIWRVYI
ncbi:shikimate dehydrogenase [Clostridium rectalis]|uniref:shikimate dehydrogenase n=1 Tax=Clostridium rectalis TaxID=2040295 RepID=UPI000F6361CC|nr:shikimate dehydrogenase [Clostridium rectalis]